jgi:hypothetical protein
LKAGTRVARSPARAMERLAPQTPWDGAATSNKKFFLGIPTGFARANSISDVPCGPILTLRQTTFTTPTFFDVPALDDEGAVLGGGGALETKLASFWMEWPSLCWSSPFSQPVSLILRPFAYPLLSERPCCQEVGVERKPPPFAQKHD